MTEGLVSTAVQRCEVFEFVPEITEEITATWANGRRLWIRNECPPNTQHSPETIADLQIYISQKTQHSPETIADLNLPNNARLNHYGFLGDVNPLWFGGKLNPICSELRPSAVRPPKWPPAPARTSSCGASQIVCPGTMGPRWNHQGMGSPRDGDESPPVDVLKLHLWK